MKKPELTEKQQIEVLETKVGTLEKQVLNCLKFMRYHAEKEANRLDPSYPIHRRQPVKAKA